MMNEAVSLTSVQVAVLLLVNLVACQSSECHSMVLLIKQRKKYADCFVRSVQRIEVNYAFVF